MRLSVRASAQAPQPSRLVYVASRNPAKVKAVEAALRLSFPEQGFCIQAVPSKSGVPDQPVGEEETQLGAVNRVRYIRQQLIQQADQLLQQQQQQQVIQEQQQQQQLSRSQEGALLVAVEGGVLWRSPQDLACFAWAAVQRLLADGGDTRVSLARSAEFVLPPVLTQLVAGGMELGHADDKVFGRTQSGQGTGTVGLLTRGVITRTSYYEHAVVLALIPYLQPDLYPEY